jgi:MFS family permease
MTDASVTMMQQEAAFRPMSNTDRKVILASCLGTVFEWYDFFLYGALATVIGIKFFGQFDETTRNIFALLTFALGFLVRPLGALVFGRFGDLMGRKNIFLTTMILMGISTVTVGLLPTSEQIGIAAPILLLALRILQGLAISGEFGAAVIYVAEHAPRGRRGFYTGWIPACIGLSLLLALLVILLTQLALGDAAFNTWGWRVPFVGSALLLVLSVWIRLRLNESPTFLKMKAEGKHSKAPISEAFGRWKNARLAVIALFGMTAGVAATGYAGTFYALVFMISALKVDAYTANLTFTVAMLLGACSCIFFAWLSDKIGRKPVILTGCLLAGLSYVTIFQTLASIANPALVGAQQSIEVVVRADPATCSFQFNPTGTARFTTPCDVAKATLARGAVAYRNEAIPVGTPTSIMVGAQAIVAGPDLVKELTQAIAAAGYPSASNQDTLRLNRFSDLFAPRPLSLVGLLLLLVIFAQMTQGPAAAALVELFPTRIRYTSMSLPYQIGTGWIGGLLPATMFAMNAQAGSMFCGLWYPVVVAGVTFVVGLFFLPETKDTDIAA